MVVLVDAKISIKFIPVFAWACAVVNLSMDWSMLLECVIMLRQNIRFLEILQLAAVQMKLKESKAHELDLKDLSPDRR